MAHQHALVITQESAIDITHCTATLTLIDWTVSALPGDSDHSLIYVAIIRQNYLNDHQIDKWNFKKADWTTYTNYSPTVENKLLIVDLYNRFYQAAKNSILYLFVEARNISQNPGGQIH